MLRSRKTHSFFISRLVASSLTYTLYTWRICLWHSTLYSTRTSWAPQRLHAQPPKHSFRVSYTMKPTPPMFTLTCRMASQTLCCSTYGAREAYAKSHVIGAVNLPQTLINEDTTAHFVKETLIVVYCWGPGCNGATKAAIKLSALGFPVKEMIGGIEYWEDRERYPVERGAS